MNKITSCFVIFISLMLYACEDDFKEYKHKNGEVMKPNEIMISAARNDDLETIKKLHSKGVPLTSRVNENGRTALHWAATSNNTQMIRYLIENGVDPNVEGGDMGEKGYTPLHDTVYGRRLEAAELLLSMGAKVDGNYSSGSEVPSPYLRAASRKRQAMCEFFLSNGADPHYTRDNGENSIIAALFGSSSVNLEFVMFLVKTGIDVNSIMFENGMDEVTPLLLAGMMNRKDIYEYLISVGADKYRKDYHGNTAEDYLKGAPYKGSFGLDVYRKKD